MATIKKIKLKSGKISYQILFHLYGDRKTLTLGTKYAPKYVERIKLAVEDIARALDTGSDEKKSTVGFIEDMTDDLKERFLRCGLFKKSDSVTIKELFERFYNSTRERKESTVRTYITVEKRFCKFFDPAGDPADLTKQDGEDWKQFLKDRGYVEATICGCFQRIATVFKWAVDEGLLEKNPFKGIKRGSFVNPNRQFFVSMDWYEKLLDACPDQTWRTILALCRIGGLRNPSETLRLMWSDIDWKNNSILVHSPKTEHHEGKKTRLIPMFPKLKEELERQWELTEEGGSPYVIDKWRDTSANMRTQFHRIIFRAGLPAWERAFQNLRESRANEIWSKFPDHVASAWMGHSKRIAQKHYLEVTDDHFQNALREGIDPAGEAGKPADPKAIGSRSSGEKCVRFFSATESATVNSEIR